MIDLAKRKGSGREILLWILALVLLRGACIANLAVVFLIGEELETGASAKAIIDGIKVPYHQLAYHYFEGGSFLIAHLKAISFLLFGQSLLANKLVALWSVLVFLAFWRLLDRHFGRTAARIGALLFLFGPDSFQRCSLLTVGSHFEGALFGLLVLDEGMAIVLDKDHGLSRLRLLLMGASGGLGIWFSYSNALPVCWVGLLLLVRRPRFFGTRDGLTALLGLLLGLVPLLVMAFFVGRRVLQIHAADPSEEFDRIARLLAYIRSIFEERSPWEIASLVLYPLSVTTGLLLCSRALVGRARNAALFLLGYLGLWLLIFSFGPFLPERHEHWHGWLRWAPPVLAMMVLLGAGLAGAWRSGGRLRGFASSLTTLLVLVGVLHSKGLLTEGQPLSPLSNLARLAATRGYEYRGYLGALRHHLEPSKVQDLEPLLGFDEPQREVLLADLALRVSERSWRTLKIEGFLADMESLEPGGRLAFAKGLGLVLSRRAGGDLRKALTEISAIDEPLRSALANGLGAFGADYGATKALVLADIEIGRQADPEVAGPFLTGVGERAFRSLVMSPYGEGLVLNEGTVRALLEESPQETRHWVLTGFEAERARWELP